MSLFEWVQNQIKTAYTYLQDQFPSTLMEQLLEPLNIIDVQLTITMDNGIEKTFQAYRSQHTNVKGPFKGGIRYHQNVSLDEVKSLSAWMSFKTSVVNLPLWWGKWGIIVNPKELSKTELEKLSRAYIQAIYKHIWPTQDVPAPDVNTTGQIMAWMADEYAKQTWEWQPWVITGKPLSIGGSKWRDIATSLGGLYVLKRYYEHEHDNMIDKKIVIQWAGNAGLNFGILAWEEWAKILAISDSQWAIYNPNGLDIHQIEDLKNNKKSVIDYPDGEILSNEQILELPCDLLVPAALENQIIENNADKLQTKLILELANGPTSPTGQSILDKKGIPLLPDILANAGGVTVSYFEQVQNNMNYYRERNEVFEKLLKIMNDATDGIIKISERHNVSLRNAAYIVALERLLEAMDARGW